MLCEPLPFQAQQDWNSDAIASTVHVSTGRHKLHTTVSFRALRTSIRKEICRKQFTMRLHHQSHA